MSNIFFNMRLVSITEFDVISSTSHGTILKCGIEVCGGGLRDDGGEQDERDK
jgi:hypothetical protein